MPDYKTMYFDLAAKVADAIELLAQAQQQGEDSYVKDTPQPPIRLDDAKGGSKKSGQENA